MLRQGVIIGGIYLELKYVKSINLSAFCGAGKFCDIRSCFTERGKDMKTRNQGIKDPVFLISVISLILFCVVIIANVIAYPLSLTDDETSGMEWFFFVLLPSMPFFVTSIILSGISVINYWRNALKNEQISAKNKVFAGINLLQILITVAGIIVLVNMW